MDLSSGSKVKRWEAASVALVLLLVIAFGLRIWGVWFGLPHIFHNDEGFEIIRALRLGTGDFDFTRVGKGGYFYLLFLEYGFLFAGLYSFGVIGSPADFGEYFVQDPSVFYLIGRSTTAIIGTITVYLVYVLGREAYSARAGLIAGALLAVNVLHAYLSHLTTVDVPMTCLVVATLYFGIKISQDGRPKDYWLAALLAAMATSTKLPALLVLVPLVIAHCYFVKSSNGPASRYLVDKYLLQSIGIFLVAYIIASPGILVHFDKVFWGTVGEFIKGVDPKSTDPEIIMAQETVRASMNLYAYYWTVIRESMSWPVFLVCLAGLAYAFWQRRAADVILGTFPVLIYIVMSSSTDSHPFFPRYIIPAVPLLAVMGGRLLDDLIRRSGVARGGVVATIAIIALSILPVSEIVASNVLMTKKDTRAVAKEWVDQHIAEGSKIFIEGYRTAVCKCSVPLQNSAENIKAGIDYFKDHEPGKAKYYRMALKVLSGKTYDLVTVKAEELQELSYYKEIGVEYFVLRSDRYEQSGLRYHWTELVDEIRSDPNIRLLQSFEPDPRSRPGPFIEIYQVFPNLFYFVPNLVNFSVELIMGVRVGFL